MASPVTMSYCATQNSGGTFDYTFTITLDNNDGTWTAGYGIGWIVFGDVQSPGPSPIADFVADPTSFPVGPWTGVSSSGGGHNGPNLSPVVVLTPPYPPQYWIPSAVGDSITWRGSSATNVPAGQMMWSALFAVNGSYPNFEVAVSCGGPACGSADFNCDGDTGTDADIEAFFACLAGNCPPPPCTSNADFNGDGDSATDADIEAFFRVLAGGTC